MNLLSSGRITKPVALDILHRVQRHYNNRRFEIGLNNCMLDEWLGLLDAGGTITELSLRLQREIGNRNQVSESQTESPAGEEIFRLTSSPVPP